MKLKLHRTDHCVVIRVEGCAYNPNFYVTFDEIDRIVKDGWGQADDCGNILQAGNSGIAFYESAFGKSSASGSTNYIYFRMNSRKFFARLQDLVRRNVIPETKEFVVDTRSFGDKATVVEQMNYSQIMKHPEFSGKNKVYEALKTVSKRYMLQLRDILSRHLQQGKSIGEDFSKASFYFWDKNGGYNGGIIWHGDPNGYSVHT